MKKAILTALVSIITTVAIAAPSLFFKIENAQSVKYQISKGWMPQPLETEIRSYNNVFKDEEVTFKWVTVYGKLAKYESKATALAKLEEQMKYLKAGDFSNAIKTQVYKECGTVNGMANTWKLNEAMKYVNELIDMGFIVVGSYKITTSVNDQFQEVYQPRFTVKVPCNYSK